MDKSIYVAIALLTVLIILFSLILAVLIFYIFKEKITSKDLGPNIVNPTPSKNEMTLQYFCKNHPDDHSEGTCAICENSFCKTCLKHHENLHFCFDHYELYMKENWTKISTVKANPNNPDEGIQLYQLKGEVWSKKDMPTYIVTHYKINFDNDFIESYVMLFGKEEDEEFLKKELDFISQVEASRQ